MSTRNRDRGATGTVEPEVQVAIGGGLLLVVIAGAGWLSLHLGATLSGDPAPANNPVELILDLAKKKTTWTTGATDVAVLLLIVAVALVLGVGWLVGRLTAGRENVDRKARYMASASDTAQLRGKGAAKKAKRLGVPEVEGAPPGVPCGRQIPGKTTLLASWEDMSVVIAGPRTFKSTAYAIPQVLAAPGPVLATSNKRDIADATRGIREGFGRVWVLDPQQIAREEPTWWWNPLTYIAPLDPATGRARRDPATGHVDADVARARKLSEQFDASSRTSNAGKDDAYFGTAGTDLLALLLLAAACGDKAITMVYEWLTVPDDPEPAQILGENGLRLQMKGLDAYAKITPKQRDGVYGTAQTRVQFLRDPKMSRWITPPTSPAVRLNQFHPHAYAETRDTVYALSKNESGGAGTARGGADHGRVRRPGGQGHRVGAWTARAAIPRRPRRGREHLPHPRARLLLLLLRLPGDRADHDPPGLGSGRGGLGPARDGEAVERRQHACLRRRVREPEVPPTGLRPHRQLRPAHLQPLERQGRSHPLYPDLRTAGVRRRRARRTARPRHRAALRDSGGAHRPRTVVRGVPSQPDRGLDRRTFAPRDRRSLHRRLDASSGHGRRDAMSRDDGLLAPGDPTRITGFGGDLDADPLTGEIPDSTPADVGGATGEHEPHFANVYVFVRDFLSPMYARHGLTEQSQWHWCRRWWDHPEAVARLEALWQVFEALRSSPGVGAAAWWRDWCDPTMGALSDPEGPFRLCGGDQHRLPPSLAIDDPPQALLDDVGDYAPRDGSASASHV